jgi:predicted TIM-barrel fold metal-dependent hydrolase
MLDRVRSGPASGSTRRWAPADACERLAKGYSILTLFNLLGNPYDTGVAAASLVFGGVLDAFPKLEINLPHAGGTFPGSSAIWPTAPRCGRNCAT